MATISFAIRSHRGDPTGAPEFVPVVDGVELMDLVARFERERDMEPAGEYGGLIPAYFKFGPANVHYFGLHGAFLSDDGKVPLLGCNCGEWTCDPIYARVEVKGDAVIWREFDSSWPDRNYNGFGPFVFSLADYDAGRSAIADAWGWQDD